MATLADILPHVVRLAREHVDAERVVLFGSQARGDARPTSDIDIAVWPKNPAKWGRFAVEVDEQAPTLRRFDLVDMTRCQPELARSIAREGKVIFDKDQP